MLQNQPDPLKISPNRLLIIASQYGLVASAQLALNTGVLYKTLTVETVTTALERANSTGYLQIVNDIKSFLIRWRDPQKDQQLLYYLSQNGLSHTLQWLFENTHMVNEPIGFSLGFFLAVSHNQPETVRCYLAKMHTKSHISLISEQFEESAARGHSAVLACFIQSPFFSKVSVEHRLGALRFATRGQKNHVLAQLLDANADQGVPFNPIRQCYILAAEVGNIPGLVLLQEKRSQRITLDVMKAAFKAARRNQQLEVMQILFDHLSHNREVNELSKELNYSICPEQAKNQAETTLCFAFSGMSFQKEGADEEEQKNLKMSRINKNSK